MLPFLHLPFPSNNKDAGVHAFHVRESLHCACIQVLEATIGLALSATLCYFGQQLAVAVGFPSASISVITLLTVAIATFFPNQLKPLVASSEGIAFILLQVRCSVFPVNDTLHQMLPALRNENLYLSRRRYFLQQSVLLERSGQY